MLALSTGGFGTVGSSPPHHGWRKCCLPPSCPLYQLPYTLLAPARYLGESATLGNLQKRSRRPFSSLSALPKPHEEPSSISPLSEEEDDDDDDGHDDGHDDDDDVCVGSETRGFSFLIFKLCPPPVRQKENLVFAP